MFFVGYAVGLCNQRTCDVLIQELGECVQQPTYRHKLEVYSDGNDDYTIVLPEHFHRDSLCYGQFIKHRQGKRVIYTHRRKVYGNPSLEDIRTNEVECFNSVLRGKSARLVRRSKDHTKVKRCLSNALGLLRFWWNFLHARNGKTPAMQEGLTHRKWGWRTFLYAKITGTN